MKHRIFFYLLLLLSFLKNGLHSQPVSTNFPNYKTSKQLYQYWDSIESKDLDFFKIHTADEWLNALELKYNESLKLNDTILAHDLSYPLAYVYHSTTAFTQCIPLFEELRRKQINLSPVKYSNVLLKLEESYLRTGNLKPAIDIRKLRIKEGHTDHFWEIYDEAGLYEEAIKDFRSNIKEPVGKNWHLTFHYYHIGKLLFKNNQIDSAEVYYLKAHEYCKKVIASNEYPGKSDYSEYIKRYMDAMIMGCFAEILIKRGKYNEAIPLLKEDIEQSRKILEISNALLKRLDLVECYLHTNQPKVAKAYLDTVSALMQNTKFYNYDFRDSKLRADYFIATKQYDSAVFYLNNYLVVKDTLDMRANKNKAIGLLAILDTDKQKATVVQQKMELEAVQAREAERRAQINLLIAGLVVLIVIVVSVILNNRQKTKRKKEIEKSLREKEILLKEIHHRVKNNLTTLKSLFYLQAKSSDKQEVKLALEECQLRIQSMAFVHQSLYDESENERVNFKHFLKQLFNELELSLTPADVDIEIRYKDLEIEMEMDVSLFLGMIINELATNSFKYAFNGRKKGVIGIELIAKNNSLIIVYYDDGIGLQKEFDHASGGFGFKLMGILKDQIKAKIKYQREESLSKFYIEIPNEK